MQSKEEIAAERRERKAKENERKIKLAKKKRNFWDIAARSKDYGVGLQMRRSIWPPENQTFWTVKRVTIKNTVLQVGEFIGMEFSHALE